MTTRRDESGRQINKRFRDKKRMLDFLLRAPRANLNLNLVHTHRTTEAQLDAVDAKQTRIHLRSLPTPLGSYPHATLRASDVLCATLRNAWRLSHPLPPPPASLGWRAPDAGSLNCSSHGESDVTVDAYVAVDAPALDAARSIDSDGGCDSAASRDAWDPAHPETAKYYQQRYELFSRYDQGIQMDREGWFSVTPESCAQRIAEDCRCDLIVDAFCGVGGNSIQFALTCQRVIAIDIDAARLRMARHNAEVYGVADRIQFVHADFLTIASSLTADVVFLSPPWGGPAYMDTAKFDIATMMGGGLDGEELLRVALKVAPNVGYYLPRNTPRKRLHKLGKVLGVPVVTERCRLGSKAKALMAYFGFDDDEGGHWYDS